MPSSLTLRAIRLVALGALVACQPKQGTPVLSTSTSASASASPSACSSLPAPTAEAASYFEFDVQVPAMVPGGFPRYQPGSPTGEILMQFVVTATGVPDMTTFKVLKTTDRNLEPQARAVVASLRFHPAELVRGCPVRQLAQDVFVFR